MTWKTIAGAAALLAMAGSASAQQRDPAAAEALFDEAIALQQAGKPAEACEKFRTSQALDPARGTLLNIARCYEQEGKTASAWAAYRKLADQAAGAGDQERLQIGRDKAAELAAIVPRLAIVVPEQARIAGLEVTRDGLAIPSTTFGVGMPVDPGEHQIRATAPDHEPWSTSIAVEAGQSLELEVPRLVPAEAGVQDAAAAGAEGMVTAAAPPPSAGSTRRTLALVAGGVGVAALATGSIFGIRASSQWSSAKDSCDSDIVCDQRGFDKARAAKRSALVADVALGVGIAAAAGAAVLWFTAPSGESAPSTLTVRVAPLIDPGGAGLAVMGGF